MAKILVTGGAGFIGSHTCRKLMDAGEEVIVYDYFQQYIFPIEPTFIENINYRYDVLLKGSDIIRGSTHNKDELRRNITSIKPDYIIHLAAMPLANIALFRTEEALNNIVLGTVNILEILRDLNTVQKFVYISSSMVYGDFNQVPMPEDGLKNPKEIYGGMKLAGEILVQVFSKRYNIPYSIVRPSAVYGPADNNRRVLQIFIENAFQRKPIVVTNPDTTFLDFTYVEDLADGLVKVTLSPNAADEVFNITRGQGHSLKEAIEVLKKFFPDLDVQVKIETESYRPNRGELDISKAKNLVNYDPKYSLEQGLEKQINFIKTQNPSLFHSKKNI